MADSLWARLEERFDEYSSLPSVEAAARDDDDDAEFGQRHTDATFKVSKRIMCEIKTSNQFRQPKQVEATVRWREISEGHLPPPVPPAARVGMSLPRLGWGAAARLVLYGGFDEAGFAPEVHLFDVGRRRWCGAEDRPAVRGRAPAPRAGHTGSALGRHAMVVYGGRGEDGLLQELHALQMHSTKPADGGPPRVTLCWSRPRVAGGGQQPSARAHHACAEMDGSLLLFGGEVSTRASCGDARRATPEISHTPHSHVYR